MRFRLTISLAHDAMQSGDDVAEALAHVARGLRNTWDGLTLPDTTEGIIRDTNGNRVGQWTIEGDEA